jgi:quercetin dioxygenase-like cupin family protein
MTNPVVEKNMSEFPKQQPYVVDVEKAPNYPALDEWDDYGLIGTNEIGVHWATAEPGDVVDWHTHAPDHYQLSITIEGKNRWYYKDNNDEVKSVDVEAGEALYLPGGAENKLEVLGDERHTHLSIVPQRYMMRMEYHMLKDYNLPSQSYDRALTIDNLRDKVVHMDKEAVRKVE